MTLYSARHSAAGNAKYNEKDKKPHLPRSSRGTGIVTIRDAFQQLWMPLRQVLSTDEGRCADKDIQRYKSALGAEDPKSQCLADTPAAPSLDEAHIEDTSPCPGDGDNKVSSDHEVRQL
eukprot:358002-Chlamydomonas_euryale.AAC.1